MAKGKKKAKSKKWCLHDLDWDKDGALYVKNSVLAQEIFNAIWEPTDSHHPLRIVRDHPEYAADDGGGVGNPKQNMQCPC